MMGASNIHNQNQGKTLEIKKNVPKIIFSFLLKSIVNLVRNLNKIIVLSRKYYKNHLNNSKHIDYSQSHRHKQINNKSDSTASFNEHSGSKTKTEDVKTNVKSLNVSHLPSTAEPVGMNVDQSLGNKSQFIGLAKQSNLVNDEQPLIPEDNKKHATSKSNDYKGLENQNKFIKEKTTADNKTIIGELER